MSTGLPSPLDRLVFHDGQLLASRDLQHEQNREAALWAMHNRYVHQTWGVTRGLTTEVTDQKHTLRLEPGHAIDTYGRDIFIRGMHEFGAPAAPAPQYFLLVVSFDSQNGWRDPASWQKSDGVPLALARVSAGTILSIDESIRPLARPLTRPRIGSGVTLAGATGWSDSHPGWLEATVDTSAAGFVHRPQYFVDAGDLPLFLVASDSQSFTVRVLQAPTPFGVKMSAAEAETGGRTISWVGIEMRETA